MDLKEKVMKSINDQFDALVQKYIDAIYDKFGNEINHQGGKVLFKTVDGKPTISSEGLSDEQTEQIYNMFLKSKTRYSRNKLYF